MARWNGGLVSFGSVLGPYAVVVKRVVGVGGGARSSHTFLIIFVTLRNRNKSSKTFVIKAKVCAAQTSFSWQRGLTGSELCRSMSVSPSRGLVLRGSLVWEGAHTLVRITGVHD